MSYSNLKSLVIKDDKVIIRSCCNNVFPKTYDPYVNEHLTNSSMLVKKKINYNI